MSATEATVEVDKETEEPEERFAVIKGFLKGIFVGVAVLALLIATAAIIVPRIIGAVPLTVLSGSMEPVFSPGDLIITMPVEADEVKRGDIVAFQPRSGDPTLITHRIVSEGTTLGGEKLFVTKGDANGGQDPSITGEQIMGKYLYHVPYLGYLANAVPSDNKALILQILGGGVILYAFVLVITSVFQRSKRKKKLKS